MNEYTAFFSYATEDEKFAAELVGALKANGFKIWYAPMNLNIGDILLDSINEGLTKSHSGILLISKEYLNKNWTSYEMDVLIRNHIEKNKKILPLWHNIEKKDIEKKHPGVAGIYSLKTNTGIPFLLMKLTEALAQYAPSVGIIPNYESPVWRFLNGSGEITIGKNGPATTIFEFILHNKNDKYPLFLDGKCYNKDDLLLYIAQLLPHIPDEIDNWVGKEDRKKLWEICIENKINPKIFE
jgi:hypothetical protein